MSRSHTTLEASAAPSTAPPKAAGLSAPVLQHLGEVTFLGSYLDHWAIAQPEARAITFLDYLADRSGVEHAVSYGELDKWSRAVATRIAESTVPGDRVALLAPQGAEFGVGFVGTIRSQAIGVPMFAPDLPGQGDRLERIIEDCRPALVLTTREKLEIVVEVCGRHGLGPDAVVAIDDLRSDDARADAYTFPESLTLDDIAYLQYTSGSTRSPVGVCLTHRNVLENALQLKAGFSIEFADASTVSWLPLFHDMGLVLAVAAPVVGGLESVILDPVAFVLQPSRWLQAINGRRNVMTAAPNFAFDYAAKRVRESVRGELDLSGVIGWINGAEPVLASTLARFAEAFAESGVTPRSVKPSYGLAEATVFVSTTPLDEAAVVLEVDPERLQHGIVSTDLKPGVRPTELVSSGIAVGQHLVVVDPDTREVLPDGRVGEIWLHGPNIGVGYWERPDESEALFNAKLAEPGDLPADHWLRTEDLGVLLEERIYVTGRIKDLVIIDGRNVYPHDVEFTIEESHGVIAQHRLAAFSVLTDNGEALVVVAERYRNADASGQLAAAAAAAREAVSHVHAVALHDFVLVEPDTIPRTSSGKIARKATREAYLAGELSRTPGE